MTNGKMQATLGKNIDVVKYSVSQRTSLNQNNALLLILISSFLLPQTGHCPVLDLSPAVSSPAQHKPTHYGMPLPVGEHTLQLQGC